eukprot:TRINITY_DN43708_c0_g1_i1.p1 TRINITY_DN43708_c0_g1~~TRINITY_DN43708_c0_g1_i1.p1  ORF type:complete len:125 (-),score=9.39 TRINITY_DN43708_c0_g1_i1:49-423(-)
MAIHVAALRGHAAVVADILTAREASVDTKGPAGRPPLHFAAFGGHVEVVQRLASLRALVDAFDSAGRSALHVAASSGHQDVAEKLVELGARLSVGDREGLRPVDMLPSLHQVYSERSPKPPEEL